ncbi:MAG: Omp28-related outer membrane protein [Flavobacteriales bacterium]
MKRKILVAPLLALTIVYSGCKVDNTQKIFDTITVSQEQHSFVYLFADQGNYFSDDFQDTIFNKALAGNVSGVNAAKLHGIVLYPDVFFDTTLFTSTAESFLQLFSNIGDQSFSSYPSVFEGMRNHQKNYATWKHSIDSVQKAVPLCGIGLAKQEFGTNVNIYAKVEFFSMVHDSVGLAVYLVENNVKAPQRVTPSDTAASYLHNHVLLAALNDDFGQTMGNHPTSGSIYKVSNSVTLPSSVNKNNVEYIAVVYQYQGDKPVKVLNCASIK